MDSPPQPNQPTPAVVLQTILNKPYEEIKAFSEWLKKNTSNYLIGEHPPAVKKGIHCHILIEGLKVSRESLRKQVIKYAPGSGQNATMAECHKTKKKYETDFLAVYILKGKPEYHRASSFSEDKIVEYASRWIEPAVRHLNVEPVATTVKKKPSNKFEDCEQILDEYFPNAQNELISGARWHIKVDCQENRTRIVSAIIAWANAHRKAMNSYLVADYYDIVLSLAQPEYYQNLCIDIINHRHRFSKS